MTHETSHRRESPSQETSFTVPHHTAAGSGPSATFAAISMVVVIALSTLDTIIAPLGIPITLLAIAWLLKRQQEPWSNLGLRRPQRWWPVILGAILGAIAMQGFVIFVVLPLLTRLGLPLPNFEAMAALEGNLPMLGIFLLVSWTTAGFGEEVIWRGFLMTRVFRIFGDGALGKGLALLLSSVGFGLLHAYQGITGIVLTGFAGLVFGCVFLISKRQLWGVILLHALIDTLAMLMLYTGVWRQWL